MMRPFSKIWVGDNCLAEPFHKLSCVSYSQQRPFCLPRQLQSPQLHFSTYEHLSVPTKAEIGNSARNENSTNQGTTIVPYFYSVSTTSVDVSVNITFNTIGKPIDCTGKNSSVDKEWRFRIRSHVIGVDGCWSARLSIDI